jgi:glycerophosphoryl diester phosphodiesterase
VELIAHRAGNLASTLREALAVADGVELDVHGYLGRLEVRHAKVLWPLPVRWDKWELIPSSTPRPTLEQVLEVAEPESHLWFDLKGFTPQLTRRVLAAADGFANLTLSSRSWWILAPARGRPGVRLMRSVGNRPQRWLAESSLGGRRMPSSSEGVVLHERLATPTTVERLIRSASVVVVWGVTSVNRLYELESLGVSGAILDDLELIRDARIPP